MEIAMNSISPDLSEKQRRPLLIPQQLLLFAATTCFAYFLLGAFVCYAQDAPKARIDQIKEQLKSYESLILSQPSLYFEYEQVRTYPLSDKPGLEQRIHYINAIRDRMYLIKRSDPEEPETWYTWKDGVGIDRVGDALDILPEPDLNIFDEATYINTIFVDCFRGLKVSNPTLVSVLGADSFSDANWMALPKCLDDSNRDYSLREATEDVDGVPCVVLASQDDVLWLDPERGYFCRRRTRTAADGTLLVEYANRQPEEHLPGLWLPTEQSITFYDDPSHKDQISRRKVNRLRRASFDRLPDEFFDVPIPTNRGFVKDHIRGISYPVHDESSTEESRLSSTLKRAKEGAPFAKRPGLTSWFVLSLAAALLAAPLIYSRLKARRN